MSKAVTEKCIKCGGTCDVVGMEATNKTMPSTKVRMIQCTCRKCGFIEFRMDDKGFAQFMGNKQEK